MKLSISHGTRKHSSRIHNTHFGGHHYVSLPVGGEAVGPQVNKFEQVSSDYHQMSVAGEWGEGTLGVGLSERVSGGGVGYLQ